MGGKGECGTATIYQTKLELGKKKYKNLKKMRGGKGKKKKKGKTFKVLKGALKMLLYGP